MSWGSDYIGSDDGWRWEPSAIRYLVLITEEKHPKTSSERYLWSAKNSTSSLVEAKPFVIAVASGC